VREMEGRGYQLLDVEVGGKIGCSILDTSSWSRPACTLEERDFLCKRTWKGKAGYAQ
jgi:hypothetical protein